MSLQLQPIKPPPPPPPIQPPPPPRKTRVIRHPSAPYVAQTSTQFNHSSTPSYACINSITPPAPPRSIQNTYSYSRSQPNTPPTEDVSDAPNTANTREMMQQQLYKTASYNRIPNSMPFRKHLTNKPLPADPSSMLSKSTTSLLSPARPPPVPKHLKKNKHVQKRKLDLVPESELKKYVPPPPPHPTESFSSLSQEYNYNANEKQKRTKRFSKQGRPKKSRGRSMGLEDAASMYVSNRRGFGKTMDAKAFNSLVLMQNIETYTVVFKTKVCGIELVPFDGENNLGAVVIRCHADYSKEKVVVQSVLLRLNGEVCINSDYDEILNQISAASRPLILAFHPPALNKNKHTKKETPSDVMIWNDEEDDLEDVHHQFMDPNKLFNKKRGHNSIFIQKRYTMLYHKYVEITQFQELTKNIIDDKMTEIKRLSTENMRLKTLLNTKQNELQQSQMSQSTEKQKGKEISNKYQKLSERNIEMERENMEQKQKIQQLEYDLKQQNIFIREHKRRAKQRKIAQKHRGSGHVVENEHNNHKRYKYPPKVTKHGMNENFQNELKSRLNRVQNDKLPTESPKQSQHYSVPNIHEYPLPHSWKLSAPNANEIHSKKKRQSVKEMFRNFGKRKCSGESDKEDKYHPEITKLVRAKKRRNINYKRNKKHKSSHNRELDFNTRPRTSRVRSNSAESSLTRHSRTRKETIV